ncbi:MAG TPA: nucleotide-binding domain containing protein, partial [Rhodopila sp.]|nr:nucleotide-binding domain containing protein [Rhodopila sp.]
GGQQLAQINGTWTLTGPHLVSALATLGVRARLAHDALTPGVNVFDAESDDTLRAIAALGRRHPGPVLWIGTGGLAHALAADHPPPAPALPQPVLGIFGSDQPATLDQLAACAEHWLELDTDAHDPMIQGPMIQHPVIERMQATGLALVSFRLPAGLGRAAAAQGIAARIARLADSIDPPGTVVVAGGETLRSLCDAVEADSLLVTGRLLPGVPCSVIQGGRWNGVTVVSKSGAFGPPDLLRRLLLAERRTS